MTSRDYFRVTMGLMAGALSGTSTAQQASFTGVGDFAGGPTNSVAWGVSSNGQVVVGYGSVQGVSSFQAFYWTREQGLTSIVGMSTATAASADGSVVVGLRRLSEDQWDAVRWTQESGVVSLGFLPGGDYSEAWDVSDDGLSVAGYGSSGRSGDKFEPFRWNQGTGMVPLGSLDGIFDTTCDRGWISKDGSKVVSGVPCAGSSQYDLEACVWGPANIPSGLGDLAGGHHYSVARGVSFDGSVIVGTSESEFGFEGFRWSQSTGMIRMGDFPRLCLTNTKYGAC